MAKRRKKYKKVVGWLRPIAEGIDAIMVEALETDLDLVLEFPELLWCVGFDGNVAETPPLELVPYINELDKIMRELLDDFKNKKLERAASIWFCYKTGTPGSKLEERKQQIVAEYPIDNTKTADRWREEIVTSLAWQLYQRRASIPTHPK